MQTLLTFFGAIINGIRAGIGLILPIFSDAADFRNWPGWVKAFIGLALVGGICYGLYFLQRWTPPGRRDIQSYLHGIKQDEIRNFFLPILFLLVVAFSWLAYGLWQLLTTKDAGGEFPDIQAAWAEAERRLASSGMRIGDAPLFLVVGRPAAGLDSLFLAAGVKDIIRTPGQGEPPIRVYAWDEAIFVVCPGASAWGKFCMEATNPTSDGGWSEASGGNAPSPGATLNPGGAFAGADPALKAEMEDLLREQTRRGDLSVGQQARLRELVEILNTTMGPTLRKVSLPDAEKNKALRRFRYLCQLIRRDRRPWCPLNGVLVLVPWATTESDDTARSGASVLAQELGLARDIFQQRYATYGLVCDLETTRGFEEFRTGFGPGRLKQRLGQRVPLVPLGEANEVGAVVGNAVRWIGLSVLPSWILRFLKVDFVPTQARVTHTGDLRATGAGNLSMGQSDLRKLAMEEYHNRNLYLLMREVFERGPRLAELLGRGIPPIGGGDDLATSSMFAGCYLAATGRETSQQAFVEGVFQRVLEGQNLVSWSPGALAEDSKRSRFVMLGYLMVGLLVVAAGAVAAWLWYGQKAA